jgi:hypothetical protein
MYVTLGRIFLAGLGFNFADGQGARQCLSPARAMRLDLPGPAQGAVRPFPRIGLKRMLSDVRSCVQHYVQWLVCCTPYVRIAEVLWQ